MSDTQDGRTDKPTDTPHIKQTLSDNADRQTDGRTDGHIDRQNDTHITHSVRLSVRLSKLCVWTDFGQTDIVRHLSETLSLLWAHLFQKLDKLDHLDNQNVQTCGAQRIVATKHHTFETASAHQHGSTLLRPRTHTQPENVTRPRSTDISFLMSGASFLSENYVKSLW